MDSIFGGNNVQLVVKGSASNILAQPCPKVDTASEAERCSYSGDRRCANNAEGNRDNASPFEAKSKLLTDAYDEHDNSPHHLCRAEQRNGITMRV